MTGLIDWASARARMIIAIIALSLAAGVYAYTGLPKEGEPDIEIPALFISVPFPGISAEDSESLLIRTMETELADLDGLKKMNATASENYAGIALEFEFGWDKTKIMADVRDAMNKAETKFPAGADKYSINEFNFSEFPVIIVNLTGKVPERTMTRVAKELQEKLESMDAVLEAPISGNREEMVEVLIDPLRLEAYNVTANELISVVRNNNQLIAAGNINSEQGAFSVKIPSSFDEPSDVYNLPVKTNGDRIITLGDLAEIKLTFEDRSGVARFNGETTVAIQVVKRRGFNLIDMAEEVKSLVKAESQSWPRDLQVAIQVGTSNDQSSQVASMVGQLEGSVLTAIALVMIVVLTSLGSRGAILVGFAIPTSFLLCFVLLGVMGVTISNMVMFGLILAVGMLVDGAIVVVEYADKRIAEGTGPMSAYVEAAKRMFWPVASSTATTLCAFLPMLFWPGVPGQFMGMLPVTLIFVLSASLIVALIFLPIIGGVSGRLSRVFENASNLLRKKLPWFIRAALVPLTLFCLFCTTMQLINPNFLMNIESGQLSIISYIPGGIGLILSAFLVSITMGAAEFKRERQKVVSGYRRTLFGRFIKIIVGNPVMPLAAIGGIIFLTISVFTYFGQNNYGVEFFVESEPEQAIVYVRARGNLSLQEKDDIVKEAEKIVLAHPGVDSVFAFAGAGGLNQNTAGASSPKDTIGQIQLETIPWDKRKNKRELDGNLVIAELLADLQKIPGIKIEVLELARGPVSSKPVHLRLKGNDWDELLRATQNMRDIFEQTEGLTLIEDTRPLPGIDWQINVDVEKAGRFGADVTTVGAMVQLVTRGVLLDTMRVDSSDEEVEIRVRLPENYRILSTLDTLKVRTKEGLIPLSNFITKSPVKKLGEINRIDQKRFFDIKAGVADGLTTTLIDQNGNKTEVFINANERIAHLTKYLEKNPLGSGISWEWTGDQEDQAESQAFLSTAFSAALALMFIILLAQFNSFYNSVVVLLAVILSTVGVLIGMLVMQQPFSVIMTGTGIVALAGIVVNNNIVLIDTYQEFSKYLPRIEAIIRTAEQRIRPVLLTTITTMAGLAPMMFGLSLNFINGGYSIDSPTSLWWKQLATAVVFGLGIATMLTLVFTPSLLALRIWIVTYVVWVGRFLVRIGAGKSGKSAQDWALRRAAKQQKNTEIVWSEGYLASNMAGSKNILSPSTLDAKTQAAE
jgi:multidrug efflux pump